MYWNLCRMNIEGIISSIFIAQNCDISGIFAGAFALNLKDQDDKGHDGLLKRMKISTQKLLAMNRAVCSLNVNVIAHLLYSA